MTISLEAEIEVIGVIARVGMVAVRLRSEEVLDVLSFLWCEIAQLCLRRTDMLIGLTSLSRIEALSLATVQLDPATSEIRRKQT